MAHGKRTPSFATLAHVTVELKLLPSLRVVSSGLPPCRPSRSVALTKSSAASSARCEESVSARSAEHLASSLHASPTCTATRRRWRWMRRMACGRRADGVRMACGWRAAWGAFGGTPEPLASIESDLSAPHVASFLAMCVRTALVTFLPLRDSSVSEGIAESVFLIASGAIVSPASIRRRVTSAGLRSQRRKQSSAGPPMRPGAPRGMK
eukprot:7388234-Prymnesium_polylepis.3